MKIVAGKSYRTRDGRIVGPVYPIPDGRGRDGWFSDDDKWWHDGSKVLGGCSPDDIVEELDIAEEWTDQPPSPVRTVTRKEIVPETYGAVDVGLTMSGPHVRLTTGDGSSAGPFVVVRLNESLLNAAELRAAAKVFTDLADALEEGASA